MERALRAALLETWSKMNERIHAADSAISARLHELSIDHGGTPEEKQRIQDASSALSVLRHEVAEWHGSQAGLKQA
jgi:uncharacterized membrane protein